MAQEPAIRRYRKWYGRLLKLYPKSYHERFHQSMEQTFSDLLREQGASGKKLFSRAIWLFTETLGGIMKENLQTMTTRNRNILFIALGTATLLLIPLIGKVLTGEVDWTLSDFVIAGVLLFGTGLTYELAIRKRGDFIYQIAVALALLSVLFLVWANGAVGIIGNEREPVNLVYFGVVGLGMIGAALSRFRAQGMARTYLVMALAMVAITVFALVTGLQNIPESSVYHIIAVNGFFFTLFVMAAILFFYAGKTKTR